MAQINLTVVISDSDYQRLLTAARWVFGTDKTEAEIVEAIRQHGIQLMRELVRNYERKIALAAAEALNPQIEVS